MKALVYEEPWKMTLRDLPKPEIQSGEVLIKMESVGICGSDVHGIYRRKWASYTRHGDGA